MATIEPIDVMALRVVLNGEEMSLGDSIGKLRAMMLTDHAAASSAEVVQAMDAMTCDERLDVLGRYCRSCGCNDPRCQCWNDE